MNRRTIVLGFVLAAIIAVAFFVTVYWSSTSCEDLEFYVGVEVAYPNANVSDVRLMVDKVRNYTNLFVIGSIELTFNETALNESCDYIYDKGLNIIVLFTDPRKYSFNTLTWMSQAKQKFGSRFLGVYRYDEPGGDQLESSSLRFVKNASSYAEAAKNFTDTLEVHLDYYVNDAPRIFTADFGLYWWDYKAKYTAVFAEFVGNQSRQRHIGLCRGAAHAHDKDWGAIITWKYDNPPHIESSQELYDDLILAFTTGAKYVIVFDSPKIGPYGLLNEGHFDILKRFWDYAQNNPRLFGLTKVEAAYVMPRDYGFGLRKSDDTIWGIFPADNLSAKAWSDVELMVDRYGAGFDILFDDADYGRVKTRYDKINLWNDTVS